MDTQFFASSSSCYNCGKEVNSSHDCEFKVAWQINPYMKVGQASPVLARSQHRNFIKTLVSAGASVGQSRHHLEGGDIVMHPDSDCVFLGYGFRTDASVVPEVERFLGQRVIALELTDPHFYHLETALALTRDKNELVAFAYKNAFTEIAWTRLQNEPSVTKIVEVTREEALKFGLNWVEVRDEIIIGSEVPKIASSLKSLGKKVNVASLSQFQFAGGSAACLVTEVHDLRSLSASPNLRVSNV